MGNLKKEESNQSDVVRDKHILVVDDIEVNRIILVKILSSLGAECDVASDGQEAVNSFETSPPGTYDLILLDWQMPTLNGLETARLIRKNYSKKIPILLLTAYDWSEIEQEAMEIGVNHFMPKPFFLSTF